MSLRNRKKEKPNFHYKQHSGELSSLVNGVCTASSDGENDSGQPGPKPCHPSDSPLPCNISTTRVICLFQLIFWFIMYHFYFFQFSNFKVKQSQKFKKFQETRLFINPFFQSITTFNFVTIKFQLFHYFL